MLHRPTRTVAERFPRESREPPPFWAEPADAVLARLASRETGLSAAEAEARLLRYGPNKPASKVATSTWRLLARQVESPLVLMLVAAAFVSWFVHARSDAAIIVAIVVASAAVGLSQERSAASVVRALLQLVAVRATVVRDGRDLDVPVEVVVPGDVVRLSAGSIVPGDLRLLQAKNLYANEASLTGETFPSEKRADPAPAEAPISGRWSALFFGTHVVSGTATGVVVATGESTEFGHVAERLRLRPPTPEFELGLQSFGSMLVRVTAVLLAAIFALTVALDHPVLDGLMFALAIAVGMTPELLPAIVTVTLSQGAKRMAAKRVIVKRLAAIENFGTMTVLCADKTGTLTEGVVRLDGAWDASGAHSAEVLELAASNAILQSGLPSPIDDAVREAWKSPATAPRKLDEIPYDFSRKRLSVLLAEPEGGNRLVTKGALAKVLEVCAEVRQGAERVPLSRVHSEIAKLFEQWSERGLRVLGVAERRLDERVRVVQSDESEMTFVGFLTFSDVPKPGIAAAIQRLERLGVGLKIITGDNAKVALTVANEVGMEAPRCMTGEELHRLSDDALTARVKAADVFAEVEPNHKERIIVALKRGGSVVGFIGDGINDASALHAADVGISVDGAADVAKEAADIVLLDHELDVLAEGVLLGRRTFLNTLKYIYITSSANFGNMLSMAVGLLFLPFLPLLPSQILLNNFLSDLPAMTIGRDRVDVESTERPRRWDVKAIRRFMFVFGSISSAFDLITFAVLLFLLHAGQEEFRSAWFSVSLLTEVLILLIMRTGRPFLTSAPSPALLIASALTVASSFALLYVPAAATAFGFVPLSPALLTAVITITAGYMLVSERAKLWFFADSRESGRPIEE